MCEITPKSNSIISDSPESKSLYNKVILYGDVDSDGDISSLDATRLQRSLVGLVTLTGDEIIAGDVDGDGVISIYDVTLIQEYLCGLITSFPVES